MRRLATISLLSVVTMLACSPADEASVADANPASGVQPASDLPGTVQKGDANDWILVDALGDRQPATNAIAKLPWETFPYKWKKSQLRYAFEGTWDARATNLVHAAFNAIGSVIPLEFSLVSNTTDTDFVLRLRPKSEMGTASGVATSSFWVEPAPPHTLYRAQIDLAYSGHSMASRDNEFLNVAIHEIAHAVGMMHSTHVDANMYPTYTVINGVPQLYFLSNDDIAGLQSIYGKATPKYPSWNHRYDIRTKFYNSTSPYPGAPPIGWTYVAETYPLWSSLLSRFNSINTEYFRVTILK